MIENLAGITEDTHGGNYTFTYYEEIPPCVWPDPRPPGVHCAPEWDNYKCWPATPANTTVYGPCPTIYGFNDSLLLAHRKCSANGKWENGSWTNYTACGDYVRKPDDLLPFGNDGVQVELANVLTDVYYAGSIISLTFLIITLFIFCYFRSLQCSRISIHKNLVVSFIFRFTLILILLVPYVSDRNYPTYRDVRWLCNVLMALQWYSVLATFSWMLVEGIFLHNRLVVYVFRSDAPFKLFYFIGWGIPAIITITWAVVTHYFNGDKCWNASSNSPFIFIIFAPILLALVINLAFLINIIRVLITKLRAHNTIESRRIRKAIKATVVLFPLLGITNCLFLAKPSDDKSVLMAVYRVTNAILPACQGIFVTVLYCFMNTEVQSVIRKKWNRFRINRAMNSRTRRRSSRTSSFFLSQSEVVFMVSFRKKKVWKPVHPNKQAPPDTQIQNSQTSDVYQ
ncbi:corticotropin-releasing factor receptor 1-like isoform X1 [Haliotis cracherodii]|uniref:corticotropin-releasing factor receptor 1-like isoform X1 n=2 Tax=Haliotis TaxID=6452 RepID=UPI0039E881F4